MAFLSSSVSNTVFRDNVRDNRLIHVSDGLLGVIGTAPFQRLRNIRQMGLASYVFPTAEHSRFVHSLGVYATAREAFQILRGHAERLGIPFAAMRFDEESEREFYLSAMCHDLGHTAFSHGLEHVLLPKQFRRHEDCTLWLLKNDEKLSKAIRNFSDLDAVILMINDEHANRSLSQLISGLLDIDRCDYLIRDSRNAGVLDGMFDFQWLMHSLSIDINPLGQPVLLIDGARGLEALRQFLGARRHMYRQVYYQSTIRSAQILISAIFECAAIRGVDSSALVGCPLQMRSKLIGEDVTVGDFIETTDIEILYTIRHLAREAKDETLRALCQMFVSREFPKTILDSAKSHHHAYGKFGITFNQEGESTPFPQMPLFADEVSFEADFINECRDIVASDLISEGKPGEIAQYLVQPDRARMKRYPPSDIVLSYHDRKIPLEALEANSLDHILPELKDTFEIFRLFVPASCRDTMRDYVAKKMQTWS